MTATSPLDKMKSILGYMTTPEGQKALSDDLQAITEADDGKQENYTTGLSPSGTAAQVHQNTLPAALQDVQTRLNNNGLELTFDQVMVTNVVVIKRLPTETRQISLTFNGELTDENAAEIWRRASLELK